MKVTSIRVQNFSVFEEAELKFCDGVNVFIGTNATGKSHLMKVMYSMMKASEQAPWKTDNLALMYKVRLPDKMAKVFRPQEDSIGRLVKRSVGAGTASVNLRLSSGHLSFNATTKGSLRVSRRGTFVTKAEKSLFIPSREVLSFHSSLIAAYKNSELNFDETYVDLANALAAAPLLGQRANKAQVLVNDIEKVLGGKVFQAPDGSLHLKNKHGDFEPHLLSEGWRKLASLCRLILNGSLIGNGFLFWDEPEANLNPEMIVKVAKLLRILAASGVQVFISTHDYLLTRYLSLAAEYSDQLPVVEKCPIRFFGFSRTSGSVEVSQAGTLQELPENQILQEFAALYDREGVLFERSLKNS